jgi:hypothetical protein
LEGDSKYVCVCCVCVCCVCVCCVCVRWVQGLGTVTVRACEGVLRNNSLRVVPRCHSRPACCSGIYIHIIHTHTHTTHTHTHLQHIYTYYTYHTHTHTHHTHTHTHTTHTHTHYCRSIRRNMPGSSTCVIFDTRKCLC